VRIEAASAGAGWVMSMRDGDGEQFLTVTILKAAEGTIVSV